MIIICDHRGGALPGSRRVAAAWWADDLRAAHDALAKLRAASGASRSVSFSVIYYLRQMRPSYAACPNLAKTRSAPEDACFRCSSRGEVETKGVPNGPGGAAAQP